MQTSIAPYAAALAALNPESPVLRQFKIENMRDRIRCVRHRQHASSARWRNYGVRIDLLEAMRLEAEALALEEVLEGLYS